LWVAASAATFKDRKKAALAAEVPSTLCLWGFR
jgi:hypothetical protein